MYKGLRIHGYETKQDSCTDRLTPQRTKPHNEERKREREMKVMRKRKSVKRRLALGSLVHLPVRRAEQSSHVTDAAEM